MSYETSRLTPAEAEASFREGKLALPLLPFNPEEHMPEVERIVPGMIGVLLRSDGIIESISAPQIGVPLPVIVTAVDGDYIRIFVDPSILPYRDKKGRQHVLAVGLSLQGDSLLFDTSEVPHRHPEWIAEELIKQDDLICD